MNSKDVLIKDICYDSFECRNPENYYYSYKIKLKNLNK